MILYNNKTNTFEIHTVNTSLLLKTDKDGILRTLYYGKRLSDSEGFEFMLPGISKYISSNEKRPLRAEYPTREGAYYCEPCVAAVFDDNTKDVKLRYSDFKITKDTKGELLEITLKAIAYNLDVTLCYRIYNELDIIDKYTKFTNNGTSSVKLTKYKSGTILPEWNMPYRLMTFAGGWGCEYQKQYTDLCRGKFTLDNTRGTAGTHQLIPFFAVDNGNATETSGEVWYGVFHYSGDFRIDFESDFTSQLTISAGINDFESEIILSENETFETPVFTTGFTHSGYGEMSKQLFDYQYDHHLPQSKIRNEFPIIYNTWYPYEFDVDEAKCLSFIEKAKAIGAELFVIDDGWFGRREKDTRDGLGDWWCHKEKFPNGLKPISDKAHSIGMKFGLWVEPEMVNIKSDLYKEHPDWILENPNMERTMIRNQCVLNLAKDEVREFIWQTCDKIISEFNLDYLKWDMNAYFTEIGDVPSDTRIRYIQNLYEIWRRLNEKYPNVLLENCASGGGRADFGLGKYSDRVNRSDNSDPIDVLKIHEGFSTIFLPRLAGGAGNVATNPHHMNGRNVPLKYRAYLGMTGSMSIGVNILKSDDKELSDISDYIAKYKKIRHITQKSYLLRLSSAFDSSHTVWEYLARDRKNAVIFVFAHNMNFKSYVPMLKLSDLFENKYYTVTYWDDPEHKLTLKGDYLMNHGIRITPIGDYYAEVITVEESN